MRLNEDGDDGDEKYQESANSIREEPVFVYLTKDGSLPTRSRSIQLIGTEREWPMER